MIAPFRIRGRTASACAGAVNDIVVDQRGAMKKFDDGGKPNRAAVSAACVTRRKEQKRGTQPLPSTTQQIGDNFGDGGKGRVTLPRKFLFDQNEVVADQIKYLLDRQQRDGASPA